MYREFDLLTAAIDVLAEYAGIGISTYYTAIESIEKNHLIEKVGYGSDKIIKVYLHPPRIYKREWLNEQIRKRKSPTEFTY